MDKFLLTSIEQIVLLS